MRAISPVHEFGGQLLGIESTVAPSTELGSVHVRLGEAFQLVEVDAPDSADLKSSRELALFEHPIHRNSGEAKEFRRVGDSTYFGSLRRSPTHDRTLPR